MHRKSVQQVIPQNSNIKYLWVIWVLSLTISFQAFGYLKFPQQIHNDHVIRKKKKFVLLFWWL